MSNCAWNTSPFRWILFLFCLFFYIRNSFEGTVDVLNSKAVPFYCATCHENYEIRKGSKRLDANKCINESSNLRKTLNIPALLWDYRPAVFYLFFAPLAFGCYGDPWWHNTCCVCSLILLKVRSYPVWIPRFHELLFGPFIFVCVWVPKILCVYCDIEIEI